MAASHGFSVAGRRNRFRCGAEERLRRNVHRTGCRPGDNAFLQYTGGTTGVSKGAALTHANLLAKVVQQTTWLREAFIPGDTSCITPLPLYHIFPVNVMFLLRFVGGTNRLLPNPREMQQLFAEMRRKPFHVMPGVNTLFNGLLASGELRKSDFAAARIIMGAGASAQQSVAERWKAATGVPLTEGYGLTECATQSISASGR